MNGNGELTGTGTGTETWTWKQRINRQLEPLSFRQAYWFALSWLYAGLRSNLTEVALAALTLTFHGRLIIIIIA